MDSDSLRTDTYDNISAEALTELLGIADVLLFDRVASTLDVAHEYAASHGVSETLILADTQTAGRGRNGHRWSSPAGAGIWLTLLGRPTNPAALDVLSLRVGLGAARALDPFADEPIRLKWPNDLYVEDRKLAGTLIEARWRNDVIEWVAIGFGVNVVTPIDQPNATGLESGTRRLDVLPWLIDELRTALTAEGPLSDDELEEFNARDLARGRPCRRTSPWLRARHHAGWRAPCGTGRCNDQDS